MSIVLLTALVKQGGIALVIVVVALVEVLCGGSHIDECHILFRCQLLHLVAVIHRMVVGSYAQARLQLAVNDGVVLAAQVVTARACNLVVAAKVATADGRNEDGCSALGLDSIDNLLQTLLVRR